MAESQFASLRVKNENNDPCGDRRYEGKREGHTASVTVNGRPLNPRLDLWNHSLTGFEWGYGGSGPAQLALALLADHLMDDELAVNLHQMFKFKVVAALPPDGWIFTSEQMRCALGSMRPNAERLGS